MKGMVRTMRTLLFLAQLPDLASCDPEDLRLGAGYKREHKDIIKIRHIVSNLGLLKKTPCSAVFYPPANAGNLAPKLLTLPECKEKLKEMHEEFLAYDGLVEALLGKNPMNEFAKKGENMGLVAQVSIRFTCMMHYLRNVHTLIMHAPQVYLLFCATIPNPARLHFVLAKMVHRSEKRRPCTRCKVTYSVP